MRITFCLPNMVNVPVGGFKIVYEYANRLSAEDYITIVYDCKSFLRRFRLLYRIKIIKKILRLVLYPKNKWFDFNKSVRTVYAYDGISNRTVPDSDFVFATAYETVMPVFGLSGTKGRKCYFIQGYENWAAPDCDIKKTYAMGFKNYVISRWLKEMVDDSSATESVLLNNPIDRVVYRKTKSQNERRRHSVGVLYHESENKGFVYAMATLSILKERYDDLSVEMFGVFAPPRNLPKWIHYTRDASQKNTVAIYNSVQVFLCTSIEEGYGLSGLEAMSCGAVLVSTEYGGVFEYAKNEVNSLLSPIKDSIQLAQNVARLFENEGLRLELSNAGVETAMKYDWEMTIMRFRDSLTGQ